ncbi:MAG: hypothetical protein KAS12_01840 [Candidatus Aenigmarchaeota archaeon]|nr:hypothetical protein [Candidatus Aenigmarchaeota archaeon]
MVLYYMDNCGYCDAIKPVWENVKLIAEDQTKFVRMIEVNSKNIDAAEKIDQFPTIVKYIDGKKITYNGDRTFDGISGFARL